MGRGVDDLVSDLFQVLNAPPRRSRHGENIAEAVEIDEGVVDEIGRLLI